MSDALTRAAHLAYAFVMMNLAAVVGLSRLVGRRGVWR